MLILKFGFVIHFEHFLFCGSILQENDSMDIIYVWKVNLSLTEETSIFIERSFYMCVSRTIDYNKLESILCKYWKNYTNQATIGTNTKNLITQYIYIPQYQHSKKYKPFNKGLTI